MNINTALTAVDLLTRLTQAPEARPAAPQVASGREPFITPTHRQFPSGLRNDSPLVRSRLDQQFSSSSGHHPRAASAQMPGGAERTGLQKAAGDVARNTWFIPGLSNMLHGVEKSDGSLGGALAGMINGVDKTLQTGLATAALGAARGDWMAVADGYSQAVAHNESTPDSVKSTLALSHSVRGVAASSAALAGK